MEWVAKIVATLAVELLRALWARQDLRDAVRYEMSQRLIELAAMAETWRRAAEQRGVGGDLRVQPGAPSIRLPGHDADADRAPAGDHLQPRGS